MPLFPSKQPQMPPVVSGPLDKVPCPHCGKPNDFRPLHEQQLVDTMSTFQCDHCHQQMQVAAIRPVTIITVRKAAQTRGINRNQAAAAPARTMSGGQVRKLLKG